MTITTTHTGHISTRSVAAAVAGTAIAVLAGLGVATWLADDGAVTAPGQDQPGLVDTEGSRNWDSWEGRIGPRAEPGGRLSDAKLRQLR